MYHAACHCELDEAKERLHGTVNKIDGKTMFMNHHSSQVDRLRKQETAVCVSYQRFLKDLRIMLIMEKSRRNICRH
jgi:hypothetical protein